MKFIILALALFCIAQTSFGASPQYLPLSAATIRNSQLIQNLRDLGGDYVIQHGVFVSKTLPGSYYELTKTEKVERKITPSTTYYRYTVILTEYNDLAIVRVNYVISYNPKTGAFAVISHNYRIIGGNPKGEPSVGGPSLIDVRPLNTGNDDLSPLLSSSVKYVTADAIKNKKLPKTTYSLSYVYNAYLEDSGFPPRYVFLVKLVSKTGLTYRVEITATETEEGEDPVNPEYVLYSNQ